MGRNTKKIKVIYILKWGKLKANCPDGIVLDRMVKDAISRGALPKDLVISVEDDDDA